MLLSYPFSSVDLYDDIDRLIVRITCLTYTLPTFTQLYDYNFIKTHRFSGPHRTTYNSSNQNNLTFGPPQPPPRKLSISLMDQILKPSISQAPTPDKLEP